MGDSSPRKISHRVVRNRAVTSFFIRLTPVWWSRCWGTGAGLVNLTAADGADVMRYNWVLIQGVATGVCVRRIYGRCQVDIRVKWAVRAWFSTSIYGAYGGWCGSSEVSVLQCCRPHAEEVCCVARIHGEENINIYIIITIIIIILINIIIIILFLFFASSSSSSLPLSLSWLSLPLF